MSEEILINVTPSETRVAVVENGMLQDIGIERSSRRGMVGNIFKGKVQRVLPGMEAAFINIGLERTAFLHVSDLHEVAACGNTDSDNKAMDSISRVLQEGQELLVQVIKDPLGSKGARLTTQISLASRFLVYIPFADEKIGISQKIEDEAERQRLKDIIGDIGETCGGFIVRTLAESLDEEDLQADRRFLEKLWQSIQQAAKDTAIGELVYEDLNLVMRVMRDRMGTKVERVRIDSRESYNKIVDFANKFTPEMVDCIEHYPGERPIFDLYGIEDEIQRALQRKIFLKSGGYLMFDQTEAMTTIDVNTGGFVGRSNLEETIFKTNLEATQSISRQLRLRNLGGIIIIDFIDMLDPEHKRQVLRALEKCLDKDKAKTHISEVSTLGLVEMTRKRTRESLEHVLCEACPTCMGTGSIKTKETVCYEIFREILRAARQFDADKLLVLANADVVDLLIDEESNSVAELEEFIGKPIKFQAEAQYTQEQYDVVLL